MPDPPDVLNQKAQQIRLVCTDVDGVLTDGGMYYSENGDELKKFNTRDGMGVALLRDAGIEVALITGEKTQLVARRAAKLGIKHVLQGVTDKRAKVIQLMEQLSLTWEQVAYIGDDLNDLEVIRDVGLSATVGDGLDTIKRYVCYVCHLPAGAGAFREFADLIRRCQQVSAKRR